MYFCFLCTSEKSFLSTRHLSFIMCLFGCKRKNTNNCLNCRLVRNFDASLRSKDPSWGVRDLEAVVQVAEDNGLEFIESVEMPANNLSVMFRKK